MPIELIVLGIQAVLRIGRASADLYGEHARDRKVFLPNLELPEGSRSIQLAGFLIENPKLASTNVDFASIWDSHNQELTTTKSDVVDKAYAAMLQHKAKMQLLSEGNSHDEAEREAKTQAAGFMVEQWREDRKPPSVFIRFALTITDIGLEFVASDPSILGIGSKGEKLVVAFAKNLSVLIPDKVSDFGTKEDFADRLVGIFLRSGLATLTSNADLVVKDKDVAKLIEGVVKPIVDSLPDSIDKQIEYRDIVDALAGPAADAAFKILAENTSSYFGKNFSNDRALGAITSALFKEVQSTAHGSSIVDIFSEQGVIRLYQATLGVAVERPELFVGHSDSAETKLFKELISGSATALQNNPRFNRSMYASLAASTIETFGKNSPALLRLNADDPWEAVLSSTLTQFSDGLADALGEGKGGFQSFNDKELLELGRIILSQVAKTPRMLGVEKTEVQAIVAGIAEAMSADDNLLLSADEWTKIAGVAAQKAAANPGKLFGLTSENPGKGVAVVLIQGILAAAGTNLTDPRSPLLFGETLSNVTQKTIEVLAGNITGVVNNPTIVSDFINQLLSLASENPEKFGSSNFTNAFEKLIGGVVAKGKLPELVEIEKIITE